MTRKTPMNHLAKVKMYFKLIAEINKNNWDFLLVSMHLF